ncbi:MAG: XrtA-associated tyrosine autokinase [Alphaproteobacteria bacterium]|nr:XrtA-associated tyrosine autokinase [Alphaproteobacteria bacterium]
MERLQQGKPSLVERAAAKLGVETQPAERPAEPAAEAPPAQRNGAHVQEAASPASVQPIEVPKVVPRSRRAVKIDWGGLQLQGMITPNSSASRLTEEFRIIKRPLITRAFGDPAERVERGNLIMVTSARPEEGKTFVAINLAISMASERGLNVLLIDSDFHHPSLPERLGFSAELGLIDVLSDKKLDLSEVLLRTDLPNFAVLPAGSTTPETTEILASQRMAAFVDEVSRRYPDRVVIFDAPPVLASSEPSVLAGHVGQIVFVIEAESTSATVVQDALGLISNCPNISLLLNKRQSDGTTEGFGSYYGYGAGT